MAKKAPKPMNPAFDESESPLPNLTPLPSVFALPGLSGLSASSDGCIRSRGSLLLPPNGFSAPRCSLGQLRSCCPPRFTSFSGPATAQGGRDPSVRRHGPPGPTRPSLARAPTFLLGASRARSPCPRRARADPTAFHRFRWSHRTLSVYQYPWFGPIIVLTDLTSGATLTTCTRQRCGVHRASVLCERAAQSVGRPRAARDRAGCLVTSRTGTTGPPPPSSEVQLKHSNFLGRPCVTPPR
jgi:hypothetical protein